MQPRFLLPLITFAVIVLLLWRGIGFHSSQTPSPLIDKPAPLFVLPSLLDPSKTLSNKNFLGHVSLFNVWASWCSACAEEHALLLQAAKTQQVIFYGLDYKDDPIAAKNWLKQRGNPYQLVAADPSGNIATDWGVYGTPQTFIIDKHGIIRYQQIGSITPDVWEQVIYPIIQKLQNEK